MAAAGLRWREGGSHLRDQHPPCPRACGPGMASSGESGHRRLAGHRQGRSPGLRDGPHACSVTAPQPRPTGGGTESRPKSPRPSALPDAAAVSGSPRPSAATMRPTGAGRRTRPRAVHAGRAASPAGEPTGLVASILLDPHVGHVAIQRPGRVDLPAARGHVVTGLPLAHQLLGRRHADRCSRALRVAGDSIFHFSHLCPAEPPSAAVSGRGPAIIGARPSLVVPSCTPAARPRCCARCRARCRAT